jgi:hypothetical protein
MRNRRLHLLGPGLLAAVIVVLAAPAAVDGSSGTAITTCGQTLTTNGFLVDDLTCAGDGVIVGAPKITIDLRGFTLRGDGDPSDTGIDDSGFDGVKVENGVVRNFGFGVGIAADGTSLSGIVASANVSDGIIVTAVGGSASVTSSTASGNGGNGIDIHATSASIASSSAYGNAIQGIIVQGTPTLMKSSIKSSSAAGNADNGFYVSGDATSISSATAIGNGVSGIEVYGTKASIKSSTASGNQTRGIFVEGDAAVVTNHAEGNGFQSGASDNNGLGIHVTGYTTAPTGKNTARGNDAAAECLPKLLC